MGVNIDIERLEIGQQFSQVRQGNGCAVGGGVLSHDDLQTNHPQIATRCAQLLSFRGLHRYAIFEARLCEEAALALKSRDTRPAGTSSRDGAGGTAAIPPGRTWMVVILLFLGHYLVVGLFVPGPAAPASLLLPLFRPELPKAP